MLTGAEGFVFDAWDPAEPVLGWTSGAAAWLPGLAALDDEEEPEELFLLPHQVDPPLTLVRTRPPDDRLACETLHNDTNINSNKQVLKKIHFIFHSCTVYNRQLIIYRRKQKQTQFYTIIPLSPDICRTRTNVLNKSY